MKTLKPIYASEYYERILQKKFLDIIYKILLKPINDILQDNDVILNSSNALLIALKNGTIKYINNGFSGNFSASISLTLRKLNAVYDNKTKSYKIAFNQLPLNIQNAIIEYNNKQNKIKNEINNILTTTNIDKILENETLEIQYLQIMQNIDNKFAVNVVDVIGIEPEINDAMKQQIAKMYSDNAKLYIKGFSQDQIDLLRQKLNFENFVAGYRAEDLSNIIQEYYKISKKKAKFLGSQENRLLTFAYRTAKYTDVGIEKFKWSTSHDVRVRDSHAMLDGHVFTYKDGAKDPITGEQIWCGSAFGCRCVDIPIVD